MAKNQVLYPNGVDEHQAQQFVEGPSFDSFFDTMKFLRSMFDKDIYCYAADAFGINVRNLKGDLIVVIKRTDG